MAKMTTTQMLTGIKNWVLGKLADITALIPSQASAQNQLADKGFVNSSIATATATFRGTYNLVTDLGLTTQATRAQIESALASKMAALSIVADNNDYAYVQIPTADATPTEIAKIEKYKYNGSVWAFEYELNNSGFTAAQWAAINSGATLELIGKLAALPTNAELTTLLNAKASKVVNATAGNFAGLDATGNLEDSGIGLVDNGAYNVTAHNSGAKFASLSALLSSQDLSTFIPVAVRKGGMSVKFVQSSDNKYVQYRLMSETFSTTESDWQGVDDEPTAGSDNLVKSGGVANIYGSYINTPESVCVWTDSEDKIILAFQKDGSVLFGAGVPPQVVEFITALVEEKVDKVTGKSLIDSEFASSQEVIISPEYLEVTTDSEGRIIEGITSDGKKKVMVETEVDGENVKEMAERLRDVEVFTETVKWKGLTAITLGDSHSVRRNDWMPLLCEKLGMIYLAELNSQLNVGNSTPSAYEMYINALTAQVATLISKKEQVIPDVIFIENVHFSYEEDNEDAFPFKPTQMIDIGSYNMTIDEEQAYFEENFASLIGGISQNERLPRTVVKSTVSTKQTTITFSANAISEGLFTLIINGSSFSVDVINGMTLQDIVNSLMLWQFEDYIDWTNASGSSNSITFKYIGNNDSPSFVATANDGGTGISISTGEIVSTTKPIYRYYTSNSLDDWNTYNSWLKVKNWLQGYMFQKGIMELLQENFPDSIIVVLGLQDWSLAEPVSDYYEFINSTKYKTSESKKKGFLKVGDMYNCRTIDVEKLSGISAINYFNYYFANDVHPKTTGYHRWAKTIADNIN